VDHEVGPVLHILAAPDELRVEVAVAPFVGHLGYRRLGLLVHHRLVFGGGDVLAAGVGVSESFDGLGRGWVWPSGDLFGDGFDFVIVASVVKFQTLFALVGSMVLDNGFAHRVGDQLG
jgi:hypothetical protein